MADLDDARFAELEASARTWLNGDTADVLALVAEVRRLRLATNPGWGAEVDRLLAQVADLTRERDEAHARAERVTAQRDRLREAIDLFGEHTDPGDGHEYECQETWAPWLAAHPYDPAHPDDDRDPPCICGLDSALKENP